MKNSKLFDVNWNDALKALLISIIVVILKSLLTIFQEMGFPTQLEWIAIGKVALYAFLSYILKNFLSNSEGRFAKREPVK